MRVPLLGARGYSVTLAGRGTPPRHALYLAEAKLGLSPFDGGVRVAGVFELGARNADVAPGVGERLLAAARPYLAGWQPDSDGPVEAWAGLRPATPDGLPLIGALPGLDGVYLATGHGMLGVTLAPATADLLAPARARGPRRARARALRPRPEAVSGLVAPARALASLERVAPNADRPDTGVSPGSAGAL